MYVRIKPPKKLNTNVPGSITTGGKTIVQGGPGVEVKDARLLSKIKRMGGEHIETSKTPFEAIPPKGGVIDIEAMKMRTRDEVESGGGDEEAGESDGEDAGDNGKGKGKGK